MRWIGVVNACALACVGVTAFSGCGSGGAKTVTVTSTSTATASSASTSATSASSPTTPTSTSSTTAATTVRLATFKSPTANIGCMIIAGTARCDIKHRSWSPPPTPKSCPPIVNYGQGLIVTGSGAGRLVCAGDTTLDPRAKALPYDDDTLVGSFRCASRMDGVTCTNTASGHGFFIAVQNYRTF